MQLLSTLDQIAATLWLAICMAVALVALGMIVHATIVLARRPRAGALRSEIRAWTRKVGDALLLLF